MSDALALGEKPAWWTSDHWATPPSLVKELASEFGAFDLDPCCMESTAKAPQFFTAEHDGLSRPWFGKVFMNPPYSDPTAWCEKAMCETSNGRAELVVGLLPVATDTGWFHDYINGKAEVRFLKGRIRFFGWKGTPITSPKSPSMIVVWRSRKHCADECREDGEALIACGCGYPKTPCRRGAQHTLPTGDTGRD